MLQPASSCCNPAYLLLAVRHPLCWSVLDDSGEIAALVVHMHHSYLAWLVAHKVAMGQALCAQRFPKGDRTTADGHLQGQQADGPRTRPDADIIIYASNSGEFRVGNLSKRGT